MRDDVDLFPNLALALAQWARDSFGFVPVKAPYFSLWRGTLSILASRMSLRHEKMPRSREYPPALDDLLELFTHPLCEWYPYDRCPLPNDIDPNYPLLHEPAVDEASLDEQVLIYLDNLDARGKTSSYALKATLDQRWVRDLVLWARGDPARREEEYRLIRRFLIQHPWATEAELQEGLSPLLLYNRAFVGDKYEQACVFDRWVQHEGQYWLCPHCGGLLTWINGQARCAKHVCEQLFPGYQGRRPIAPRMDLRRLSWIIHARVCLPGKTELTLYDRLRELEKEGVRTILWPGADACDHYISILEKVRLATDVKDYESPITLARAILEKPFPRFEEVPSLKWDRAFYVIPRYRTQLNPRYLDILRNLTKNCDALHNVAFCDEEQLYQMVVQELDVQQKQTATA